MIRSNRTRRAALKARAKHLAQPDLFQAAYAVAA